MHIKIRNGDLVKIAAGIFIMLIFLSLRGRHFSEVPENDR